MTTATANQLLERYFAGETSLEEERRLGAYFANPAKVDPVLHQYAPLFAYWARERAKEPERQGFRPPARRRWLAVSAAAAALAACLLLAAWWFLLPNITKSGRLAGADAATTQPIDWSRYEVTDEREAIRLLHRSLKPAGSAHPVIK